MDTQDSHVGKINKVRPVAAWLAFIAVVMLFIAYALMIISELGSWSPNGRWIPDKGEVYTLQAGLLTFAIWIIALRWSLAGGLLAVVWAPPVMFILLDITADYGSVFMSLGLLLFIVSGFLYIFMGLMERKGFFLSKSKGKYRVILHSIVSGLKSKRWYLHNLLPCALVFAVIAIISFTAGMTLLGPRYGAKWDLNLYLWTAYGSSGTMPWESKTTYSGPFVFEHPGTIAPFLTTLFWWGFLSVMIVSVAKILLARIKRSSHKIEPVPGPSH